MTMTKERLEFLRQRNFDWGDLSKLDIGDLFDEIDRLQKLLADIAFRREQNSTLPKEGSTTCAVCDSPLVDGWFGPYCPTDTRHGNAPARQ